MKNRIFGGILAAAMTLGMSTVVANASTIADYQFTGATAPVAKAPTTSDPNVTAGSVVFGGAGGNVSTGTHNAYFPFSSIAGTDEASAANYFQFTIAPVSNYTLDLTSIAIQAGYSSNKGTGTISYFVRSDAASDNFTTTLPGSATTGTIDKSNSVTYYTNSPTFTLGSEFDNLTAPTTFRLYVYSDGMTAGDGGYGRLNYITFSGTASPSAPIPEPASLTLLGLGGLTLLARRRRA